MHTTSGLEAAANRVLDDLRAHALRRVAESALHVLKELPAKQCEPLNLGVRFIAIR